MKPPEQEMNWGERALAFARAVANIYPRGSATPGEARAAEHVCQELGRLGITEVQVQPFQGLRSIWLFLALPFGLALTGHAAFWLLRAPVSTAAALLVCLACFALALFLLWRKFTFQDYPLRAALPHGPSQNVIAVIPPKGETQRKVVLVGHLDGHRAVWWFANDFLVRIYGKAAGALTWLMLLAPICYIFSELLGQPWLAWVGAALAVPHFLAWLTAMTADLGPYSPSANDNASAVGSLLALGERLGQQPLEHTETWLAFTGCEESGCDGMRSLLAEHGKVLQAALFIDFELVGIGERLAYLRSEGLARPRSIPAEVEQLIQRVSQRLPIIGVEASRVGAFTESGVAWEKGFQGACLLVQRENSPLMPEWHRMSDRPERLEVRALGLAHDFAWEMLQAVDGLQQSPFVYSCFIR